MFDRLLTLLLNLMLNPDPDLSPKSDSVMCTAEPDIATPKSGAVSPFQAALKRQFSDVDARDLKRRHQEMADQARARPVACAAPSSLV